MKKNGKLYFGYLIVAALVITSFIPLSLGLSCAGIFYPSLSADLGVGKGMLSYYSSIIWVSALITLPVMGRLLNNKDARICLTVAVAIIAVTFVWLSLVNSLWQFYAAGFVMGIGVGMLLFLAPSTLINRWFAKRAGVLLGVVMAFTGIGGAVWSTVGGILIHSVGWSTTYLVFAALSACTIPTTLFMVSSRPQDKGLEPFGYEAVSSTATARVVGTTAITASEAFRTPGFYLILMLCFLINIGMYVYFMIPSYASTLDISATMPLLGATASSVAMLGQTISKLALGAVGEKHPYAGTIITICFGIVGLGMFAMLTGSIFAYYVAALFFGFYYGITNVMMPLLTRRSFGDKEYAKIYSRISMIASISNAVAGFIWGAVIDATGSFTVMFVGVAVIMVMTCGTVVAIWKLQSSSAESSEFAQEIGR